MASNLKLLGSETDLTSATTVNDAVLVRLYNTDTSGVLVTLKDSEGTTKGTMTVPAGSVNFIQKEHTDTLEGGAAVLAVSIAWTT